MDAFDLKLLAALQNDGRLTNNELAEEVGLSASQCSRRRAQLEQAGVIASYHALLSADALGLDVAVFVEVTLATHSPDNSKRFQRLIDGLDEVQEAYSLTGSADYLVKLLVPDLKALSRILNEVFLPHESVEHVQSSIVLERLKSTMRLPLSALATSIERDAPATAVPVRSLKRVARRSSGARSVR
jgi:DNA-binding Lrp family transcriptional regulator